MAPATPAFDNTSSSFEVHVAPRDGAGYGAASMSIPVSLERLRAASEERGSSAYLLTVGADGRPHAVHAPVRWEGDVLAAEVGRRSVANAVARPAVSLLFPVRSDGDYSLIVDGMATIETTESGHRLLVTPTKAVLHRPAAAPDPTSSCAADCVALLPAARERN
ncbi:MAG TPA: pyridoxamine 5'-phosphate oxidase family protein [Candidatus Binatia bacterium]|nr:pyridoxamine 5'-phosphate oxidase family protein [Candidatus Binatia bacterium]